ncbi:phospholipase effector Tle1 domain-containing protein [Acinetobacter rudis]|uniref:T6SS Phospholipase effector Tle1-like catalytic domain-containing protein n=1 Tax=Acinetobacter rudis CIP 110305 TaxID=421052 RepID=S3N3M7_9GAMM|nr:DUF2235 domain-containing protein [Acinetobacter rudis]EPF74387.1 hypothetical protein F945_01600 [Acinetobacter rudis CIP 110305]
MGIVEKKPGQQPLNSGNTSLPADTYVDVSLETLTIHVFFDGTRNNRFNTAAARKNTQLKSKDVSYENYYSNIALLFMAMATSANVKKIYIEGSGTSQGDTDSTFGLGMASGDTGREKRMAAAIKQLNSVAGKIDRSLVILNVYGFSRGAAWARNFCHLIKLSSGGAWRKAKINFVGIYDTVSSDGAGHYNDVEELGLDIGSPQGINYIAHLTAQNDYREHFPLTPIHGAIKDGVGFECSFPGAHSDVGGGYSESFSEKDKSLGIKGQDPRYQGAEYIDYNWFINTGYYTLAQIKETKSMQTITNMVTKLYGNRKINYHYQFITGDIMRAIAEKKAGYIQVANTDLGAGVAAMKKIALLSDFYSTSYSYVMQNYNTKKGGFVVPNLAADQMKQLYNLYIHNSLDYGDIANCGTLINKKKKGSKYDYSSPVRPHVTEGFR